MKNLLIIFCITIFYSSCKKEKIHDPFEGEWYLQVDGTGYYATYFRMPLFEVFNSLKSPVRITKAGDGKYYITDTSKQMNALDYSQTLIYSVELKPKTDAITQQFVFEKIASSDSLYYIKSFSNPDKLLSVVKIGSFDRLIFESPNTAYRQQWKLKK